MEGLLKQKYEDLKRIIRSMESVLIAYSGGVDSTLLAKVAFDELGDKALAVTAVSETYPKQEVSKAEEIARMFGIKHEFIVSEELSLPEFSLNPTDRCYYCKRELFRKLKSVAKEKGINYVVEGSNFDDLNDYRPGMKALKELNIRSPLIEARLTKDEIRQISKELNLPTWNKPSFACLASRFPYGTEITREKLRLVDEAETFIRGLGVNQLRVRHHDRIARIEVSEEDMITILNNRRSIVEKLKSLGYSYITLDLQGYRTGSMNEVIGSTIGSL